MAISNAATKTYIAVIPARFGAQRFPGKPLALIAGKPMIQHVYARCLESGVFSQVIVATEDERIVAAVSAFQGRAMLTSPLCQSGSDRVGEVAAQLQCDDRDVLVNVQGDEPAIHPESVAEVVKAFENPRCEMATLIRPLLDDERLNPNVVKVVLDEFQNALYFSRSDIPFIRQQPGLPKWAHVGIYGFRAGTLRRIAALPPTALEKAESLEQLRALGNHISIACRVTPHSSQAVDVESDVPLAEAALLRLVQNTSKVLPGELQT
jgi:3-deoxy-manno-octulosonate cytidylyltransferase (CMP-KDO synthetase)